MKSVPTNNAQLRVLAREALDNWNLDADTDPDGIVEDGLLYYSAQGDAVPDGDVSSLFEGYPTSWDVWDVLEELCRSFG